MRDEVAVVVGVGPGLGAALVKRFAKEGFTTIAVARRASSLTSLRGGNDPVISYDCDATVPEQVERLFQKIQSDYGPLCITVFNAGAFERREVVETDPADFERCWRIGCFAGFLVGKTAARVMLKQGQGTILFTGATASLRGSAGFVNLAAPKFALRALAQSMARELSPHGIHVAHVIIDGQIRSERYQPFLAERGADSLLEPDAIADAYLALHRQQRIPGRWSSIYGLGSRSFEPANWYLSNHPTSIFVTGLMAARPAPDRRYALLNNQFAVPI